MNQLVSRYYFNGDYQTAQGIKIDDDASEAINAYGENYYERWEQGARIIGYFDKEHHINIEFICYENKVKGVILEKIS